MEAGYMRAKSEAVVSRSRPRKKAARTSRLVSARQASEESGVPYTTLRSLAFAGELPVVKIGIAWYFRREDIEAFISRNLANLGD